MNYVTINLFPSLQLPSRVVHPYVVEIRRMKQPQTPLQPTSNVVHPYVVQIRKKKLSLM